MEKEYICRCEEITKEDILQAIQEGRHTVSSIKKATRAGMGACQGRTCGRMIMRLLVEQGVLKPEEVAPDKPRFPLTPVKLESIQLEVDQDV
jgi:NAD(P)H-nitrite reductase large subunit